MADWIVYQWTNAANGNRYIGYSGDTLDGRMKGHVKSSCRPLKPEEKYTHFQQAIRKYGAHSFVGEVLFVEESKRAACETEILLILDRQPEYNKTMGGDGTPGHPMTDELREKIRKNTPVRRGEDHPMFGKSRPDVSDRNKGQKGVKNPNKARSGESNPMFGKSHSEATIQKMSIVKQGKLPSEETKAKQSASAIARSQTEEGKANARSAGRKGADARWAKHRAAKLAAQNSEGYTSE